MVQIVVWRTRVPEMMDRGYRLLILPLDGESPAIMEGPDPDDFGTWTPLAALAGAHE